jgi:hypothetical protein
MTAPYPRIVVWRGGQVVGEHALPVGAELVVGRSEGCGVVVGDSSVSRLHARLISDEHGVYLEDLGSANGTYVDGVRVQGGVRLAHGQQVRVAQKAQTSPVVLRFEHPAVPVPAAAEPGVDVGAATVAMRSYGSGPLPLAGAAEGDDSATDPPRLVALPPRPAPLASTTPMRDEPAAARAMSGERSSRRGLMIALVGIAALGALAVAGGAAWWLLRGRGPWPATAQANAVDHRAADAAPLPAPAVPAAVAVSSTAPAAQLPPPPALLEATPEPTTEPTPAAAARAAVGGKWTARLENLFYPEDDYVVTVRLDLQQRGNTLSGRGQAAIEGKSMTFGVPAVDASGSVLRGAPPRVRLRLPFGRPIGELELEAAFENGALAGIYRSSLLKQPGTWHAARDQE